MPVKKAVRIDVIGNTMTAAVGVVVAQAKDKAVAVKERRLTAAASTNDMPSSEAAPNTVGNDQPTVEPVTIVPPTANSELQRSKPSAPPLVAAKVAPKTRAPRKAASSKADTAASTTEDEAAGADTNKAKPRSGAAIKPRRSL